MVILSEVKSEKPIVKVDLFLAQMLPVEGQLKGSYIPALDMSTDPHDESDQSGLVVISNVPPGFYALVMVTPLGAIQLQDSVTSENINFHIKAGEVLDLGNKNVAVPDFMMEQQ